jgi:hypothetical protein
MRPSPLPGRLLLAGFLFLFLTLIPGLISLLPSTIHGTGASLTLLTGGGAEWFALAALGGWLVSSVIGTCYKLLPVFMPAPDGQSPVGNAVFYLSAVGTALAMIGSLIGGMVLTVLSGAGAAAIAVGVILYCAELSHVRIYGVRPQSQSSGPTTQRPPDLSHRSAR